MTACFCYVKSFLAPYDLFLSCLEKKNFFSLLPEKRVLAVTRSQWGGLETVRDGDWLY